MYYKKNENGFEKDTLIGFDPDFLFGEGFVYFVANG